MEDSAASQKLTEQDLIRVQRQRQAVMLPALGFAVGGLILILAGVLFFGAWVDAALIRLWGPDDLQSARGGVFFLGFVLFIVPLILVSLFVQRYKLLCPRCGVDVFDFRKLPRLKSTGDCPSCGERIMEGGPFVSPAEASAERRAESLTFLRRFQWVFPVLAGAVLVIWIFEPTHLEESPYHLWTGGLLGTVVSGWGVLRTRERGFWVCFVVSLTLLALGVGVFWWTYR